jgi:hypothetical protein
MTINERVYSFKTANEKGFILNEIEELLMFYPDIDMDAFNNSLKGVTGLLGVNNEFIFFKDDIEKALICGVNGNRSSSVNWD